MGDTSESVFVSYAGQDGAWAEWVAWHLREAGHRAVLDVWEWRAGDDFVERMNDALARATAMVALFSNSYFDRERWTTEEWKSVVARRERLIPVTIEPLTGADVPPILAGIIRKDLYGLDEPTAKAALLDAVSGPTGPLSAPAFPGRSTPDGPAPASDGRRPRLPSSAGMPQVWNVRGRNPHFTGREDLLTQVREGLLGGRQAVIQALHGLGGIGKTQIALEYAHRFASQYDTVWWIDAEQADQIPVHYTELAVRLGIAKTDAGADHTTRILLDDLRTRERWLLILDNADDPRDFDGLLPVGPGHVMITSRNPDWNNIVHSLNLGVFSRADSLAYLSARMPGLSLQQAEALADDLGDLPLAQAAGVVCSGMTVDRYRQLLTDRTASLLANGLPPGYTASLAAAVDIATTRLAADHPDAAALLRLGAFLGPDPVPTAWLENARDHLATIAVEPNDFMWPQAALQHLARYGLARVDHETFQIHRLTQAILRDHTIEVDTIAVEEDVTAILSAVAPGDPNTPASWAQWAALASHLAARQHTATHHPHLRSTLLQASAYLNQSGQSRAAHDLTTSLHRTWASALGEDHADTLDAAFHVATSLAYRGLYAEARRGHEQVLERRRHILGEDHPDTLHSANNLSSTLSSLGEHVEGRRMDEDVLERRRRVLGEDHPDTLCSAQNLAVTLGHLGEDVAARRMSEDVLERRRRVLGEDHPDTLHSAQNLANILSALGEHVEGRRMCVDVLERRRRVLGEDHPDTLRSAQSLANFVSELGEHVEGRRMCVDVLDRCRRVLGEDHPDTLHSAHSLAITLCNLGEHVEGRRMSEDVLDRCRRVLGEDHPETLRSAQSLAITLCNLGEHVEGRRMSEDVLERRRRVLGEDHPDTLYSVQSLAITLGRLGEHAKSTRLLRDARVRSRRTLGNDHPFTEAVTHDLAQALTAAGRPFEAAKLRASGKPKQQRMRGKRR
ncbi:FxSxx-COOH system tetratricopeptide repeat protein [Streptomyces longwoodensis]|uniref:FxSxx-COOH system tetratricopeptide repeat protein n=1 Tax=Streptomyces longwoodensis TaxID=68231 RepID=UPI003F56E408